MNKKLPKWYGLAALMALHWITLYAQYGRRMWILTPLLLAGWFVALKMTYWKRGIRL